MPKFFEPGYGKTIRRTARLSLDHDHHRCAIEFNSLGPLGCLTVTCQSSCVCPHLNFHSVTKSWSSWACFICHIGLYNFEYLFCEFLSAKLTLFYRRSLMWPNISYGQKYIKVIKSLDSQLLWLEWYLVFDRHKKELCNNSQFDLDLTKNQIHIWIVVKSCNKNSENF